MNRVLQHCTLEISHTTQLRNQCKSIIHVEIRSRKATVFQRKYPIQFPPCSIALKVILHKLPHHAVVGSQLNIEVNWNIFPFALSMDIVSMLNRIIVVIDGTEISGISCLRLYLHRNLNQFFQSSLTPSHMAPTVIHFDRYLFALYL